MSNGRSPVEAVIRFCLDNVLVVALLTLGVIGAGLAVAPFDWIPSSLPRDPVAVDAIPDLGENQQIVFTEWPGRSPRDMEDQVTYPLTVALMGLADVRTVRSQSFFGFSSVYVVFEDGADFHDSRTRILEKLASLPPGTLPAGVRPSLGPDATALGQVFWYTLEGRDEQGRPAGGWNPEELRSIQDWYVRYGLAAADGVAEVASVGGFVREYQVDVDPDALRAHGVTLAQVYEAVRSSNAEVGARTLEINSVEYVVRGVGFVEEPADIAAAVVDVRDGVPVRVSDVAVVGAGPAPRRGALDRDGAEAVGGVVVARHGENPMATIAAVKRAAADLAPGLPSRTLADGRVSKVTIVPFYDRSGLIRETLGTLETALVLEILITIVVVIVLVSNLRGSLLVAGLLPVAVLATFGAMKAFGVEANVVALSGIAIAIGTMVDMGIVLTENIIRRLGEAGPDEDRTAVILKAASEVGGAVLTAVATTVVSFLPVFTMEAAEGKLFKPLATTKTFALIASIIVALTVIPALARVLYARGGEKRSSRVLNAVAVVVVGVLLALRWLPLGPGRGIVLNVVAVAAALGGLLWAVSAFIREYPRILAWCLDHKGAFLALPTLLVATGLCAWLGFERVFTVLPGVHDDSDTFAGRLWEAPKRWFPGLGQEFMPPLDEGSFLFMPTTMPHASIGEASDVLAKLDLAIASVPEVAQAVGKIGRVDSALDPAPISMVETVINYLPEYRQDADGRRLRFRFEDGAFVRDESGELVPDRGGRPYRQWRDHIRSAGDIWDEIVDATRLPGTTSAPLLQPIAARLVMLQSGMRAPMGVKVRGPDLETVDRVGQRIEGLLKTVAEVEPAAVVADRIVGKPYLEIHLDREALALHGIPLRRAQDVIETAIGGRTATTTVEGRERYAVRVRYQRERRDTMEDLADVEVPAAGGASIPLAQLAEIRYVRGPQAIKSEDTFLTGYVLFDKAGGVSEVEAVEAARARLDEAVASGELVLPSGTTFAFAGSWENQVRAERRLAVVLPAALGLIVLILYLQFRSATTTALVFVGVFVAWAGGFLLVWSYGQSWFLQLPLLGDGLRDLLQVGPVNLSVAVWVGFLALFGIATDDGVLMASTLDRTFADGHRRSREEVRRAVVEAASRRIRPAMMTTATTILALLPVLTSTGRGSDIMIPMAIPSVGGMTVAILTVLTVPVLYCWLKERRLGR